MFSVYIYIDNLFIYLFILLFWNSQSVNICFTCNAVQFKLFHNRYMRKYIT
jgi:hypothetical protein